MVDVWASHPHVAMRMSATLRMPARGDLLTRPQTHGTGIRGSWRNAALLSITGLPVFRAKFTGTPSHRCNECMASPRFVKLSSLDLNALFMPPPPPPPPPTPLQQPQTGGDGAATPSAPPPSLPPCPPRRLTTLLEYAVERGQDAVAGALLKGGAGASVRHDAAAAGHDGGIPPDTAAAGCDALGSGCGTQPVSCLLPKQPLQGSHCAEEDARECLASVLPMHAVWIVKQVVAMRAAAAASLTGLGASVAPPVGEARGGGFEHGPAASAGIRECADSSGPATCSICLNSPTCPLIDLLCGHLCCEACIWARLRAERGRAGVGCPCGSGSRGGCAEQRGSGAGGGGAGRRGSGAGDGGSSGGRVHASCGDDAEDCCGEEDGGEGGGEEGSSMAEAKSRKQASAERCVKDVVENGIFCNMVLPGSITVPFDGADGFDGSDRSGGSNGSDACF